jgi:hypothetical protein
MSDSIDLSDIDINIGGSGGTDTITLDAAGYPSAYYASGMTVGGITSIGSITVPHTISTSGTNSYTYGAGTGTAWVSPTTQSSIKVTGDADFDGDVKIKGHSITNLLEKIEERLGILNPNPELEERWDKLKELRKQYIEMEKDLLEKEKIMKILKES